MEVKREKREECGGMEVNGNTSDNQIETKLVQQKAGSG